MHYINYSSEEEKEGQKKTEKSMKLVFCLIVCVWCWLVHSYWTRHETVYTFS